MGGGSERAEGRTGPAEVPEAAGHAEALAALAADAAGQPLLRAQVLHAQRLAAIGQLTAGLTHQAAGPLACVLSALHALREDLDDPAVDRAALREAVDDALLGAQAVREILTGVRTLGRRREDGPAEVDVLAELQAAVALARHEVKGRARLALELPEALPRVVARPGDLGQVFLNLLVNAAQAIPKGDQRGHEVRVEAWAAGDRVAVSVRDTGVGIPEAVRPRLFEPYFTTRPAGRGAGLGLATCRTIVAGLGGQIEVESTPGRGSLFRVGLPAAAPAPRAAAS